MKADKTTHFYKMKPKGYREPLEKNVQKTYKKTSRLCVHEINQEAKAISKELNLEDRVEIMAERDAFITLKDHEPNFNNVPTCRLISPTKSEIGRISKDILQHIVKKTAQATNVNLWRKTQAVIKWFNGIQDKQNSTQYRHMTSEQRFRPT